MNYRRYDSNVKTIEDLVEIVKKNPLSEQRWRIDIWTHWNDEEPPEYSLQETGESFRAASIGLTAELGAQLEEYWRKNSFGTPIGGLKLRGVIRRWDDDHGTDFFSDLERYKKHASVIRDHQTYIQRAKELQEAIEAMIPAMRRDVLALIPGDLATRLIIDMKAAHDAVTTGLKKLKDPVV